MTPPPLTPPRAERNYPTQTKRRLVDHCVIVDANNGIIFASVEEFAIRLCGSSLWQCAGSNCDMLQITEVFELY